MSVNSGIGSPIGQEKNEGATPKKDHQGEIIRIFRAVAEEQDWQAEQGEAEDQKKKAAVEQMEETVDPCFVGNPFGRNDFSEVFPEIFSSPLVPSELLAANRLNGYWQFSGSEGKWVHPYALLAGICLYYFLATTVHPWYLTLPLILCIFTRFRFPIVWSVAVVFSYSAYNGNPVDENLWLITAEYFMVYGYLIYEVISYFKEKSLSSS